MKENIHDGFGFKQKILKQIPERQDDEEIGIRIVEHYFEFEEKEKKSIRVGIANLKINHDDSLDNIKNPNLSFSKKQKLWKLLNLMEREDCDLFVLPELSIPHEWLQNLAKFSDENQKAIIFGLEHFKDKYNRVYNLIVTILPFKIFGYKASYIRYRLKNHYSPEEKRQLINLGYRIPIPLVYCYDLFSWNGVSFSCYNCFEFTDINHRSLFKSDVDFIVAVEYNKDINYFSNIVESIARDIHCYVIQVNNSCWGDSRITQPSPTEIKDIIKIKGGENSAILIGVIDIDKLRNFQIQDYETQRNDENFKPTPPDFDQDNVRRRMGLL